MTVVEIAAGGAAGAVARYLVDGWVSDRTGGGFPLGTLVVNLSGAFLLGLLATLAMERAVLPAAIRPPVMIGFLGAYTTFSTWMLESWRLAEQGAWLGAFANIGGSVVLGIVAMGAGIVVGRAL
jgi:fluoride exporter